MRKQRLTVPCAKSETHQSSAPRGKSADRKMEAVVRPLGPRFSAHFVHNRGFDPKAAVAARKTSAGPWALGGNLCLQRSPLPLTETSARPELIYWPSHLVPE